MKLLSLAMLVAVAAAATAGPAATLYCKSYTTATACSTCPTAGNMSIGVKKLSGSNCSTNATALVTKNPKDVIAYDGSANALSATNMFTCKEGMYGLWNATAAKVGCYSSSDVDGNTTDFGTNAKTAKVIANCATANYNATTWTCKVCKAGFVLNLTATTCTAVATALANCEYYATATTCSQCKSGYVVNSASLACVKETSTTKNCAALATGNLKCGTCKNTAAFETNETCKSYNATTIAFSLLAFFAVALFN